MATPTWRNVNTGGDGGASRALEAATRTFDRAFGSIQDIGDQVVADARFVQARQDQQEQQAFDNQLATNQDTRAQEQLLIRQDENARAQTRLEDQLLSSAQTRDFNTRQENRSQYRFGREVLDNKRADARRSALDAARGELDQVLANSDVDEIERNLVKLARKHGVDDSDLPQFLQQAQLIDKSLYGLSGSQQAVFQEQQQLDQLQEQEFINRSERQLETVAAGAGISPQLLNLQRDPESAQSLIAELNKASGGEATDMVRYFTEKFDKLPTRQELQFLAGLASEEDWTPFVSGEIDLDANRLFGDGYKKIIDEYADSIGVGTSEKAKQRRKALEAWYELKDNQTRVLQNLRKTQADNQATLLKQARKNNVSRVTGNNEVESIFATPVQSEATRLFNQRLSEQTKKASGARPDFKLPGYLTGNY